MHAFSLRRFSRLSVPVSALTWILIGCKAGGGGDIFDTGGAGGKQASSTVDGVTTGDGVTNSSAAQFMTGGSTGAGPSDCVSGADEDKDQDGFSVSQGDCNDCDSNVNPQAIEVKITEPDPMTGEVPAPADEDCDTMIDNVPAPCDDAIAVDEANPVTAARAVELCKQANPANPKTWGVISARWVYPDGSAPNNANFDVGHGVLPKFGNNVTTRAGANMLSLSSGGARDPLLSMNKGYTTGQPPGFPKESPSCPNVTTGTPRDGAGLEVDLRAPTNATGFSFQFKFYTIEWPSYICSQFNDFFVAILSPTPMGQSDGNISFDSIGNPVSVNNAFLDVCGCSGGPPCTAGGKSFACAAGTGELDATGFTDHAGTSWLQTNAPIQGSQSFTLRWSTYDSGDGNLDSTTLVDNFQWIANGGTVVVGTNPVPQ